MGHCLSEFVSIHHGRGTEARFPRSDRSAGLNLSRHEPSSTAVENRTPMEGLIREFKRVVVRAEKELLSGLSLMFAGEDRLFTKWSKTNLGTKVLCKGYTGTVHILQPGCGWITDLTRQLSPLGNRGLHSIRSSSVYHVATYHGFDV